MRSLAWILGRKQLVGGRCIHPWRVQVLPRQDQGAQVCWWQQSCYEREISDLHPLLSTHTCGSKPWSLLCLLACCKSSFCFLQLAFCCLGLQWPLCYSTAQEKVMTLKTHQCFCGWDSRVELHRPRGLDIVQSTNTAGEKDG